MRDNNSDPRKYLEKHMNSVFPDDEKKSIPEPDETTSSNASEEMDDLEDLLWLFGDEYYISTESYEGVTKNYIRCLENMLEEFEPSDDPFQYKLIRETLEQAEALRIRLLAVTAYNMQMEAAVQNHDNDPDDFDPDELPF